MMVAGCSGLFNGRDQLVSVAPTCLYSCEGAVPWPKEVKLDFPDRDLIPWSSPSAEVHLPAPRWDDCRERGHVRRTEFRTVDARDRA